MENTTIINASGEIGFRMNNDYLFKALLQKSKTVLRALIRALLHLKDEDIISLSIVNPIIPGEMIYEKEISLDINVEMMNKNNDTVERIDLEMQVINEKDWPERSLYYACRNYAGLEKGGNYLNARSSIHIGFLDFTLFPDRPKFYATYKLMDIENHYRYTDKLSIGVVDLSRIDIASCEDKRYNIDKWARLFKATTWEELKMLAKEDNALKDAADTVYEISRSEHERWLIEAREDYLRRERDKAYIMARATKEKAEAEEKLAVTLEELVCTREELAERDSKLAERDSKLAERDKELAAKDAMIASLKAQLADASK